MAKYILQILERFCPVCGKHRLIAKGQAGQAYCTGCGTTVVLG